MIGKVTLQNITYKLVKIRGDSCAGCAAKQSEDNNSEQTELCYELPPCMGDDINYIWVNLENK